MHQAISIHHADSNISSHAQKYAAQESYYSRWKILREFTQLDNFIVNGNSLSNIQNALSVAQMMHVCIKNQASNASGNNLLPVLPQAIVWPIAGL